MSRIDFLITITLALLPWSWAPRIAQAQLPQATTHTLSGTVVDADDAPVFAAQVTLGSRSASPGPSLPARSDTRTAETDQSGRFRFDNVEFTNYWITVESDDGTSGAVMAGNIPLDVHPAITIPLHPIGSISGRVLDENDQPIQNAKIELLARLSNARRSSFELRSDADGAFRFAAVPPGDYFVRASPQDQPERADYPTTYYPNATDPVAAGVITVSAGNEASRIDIHLARIGVRIKGHIKDRINPPPVHRLVLIPRNPGRVPLAPLTFVRSSNNREFEIWGVAPGSYYLYCTTGQDPNKGDRDIVNENDILFALKGVEWVRIPVEVGREGIQDLSITMTPPGSIRGSIRIDADATDVDALDRSTVKVGVGFSEEVPTLIGEMNAEVTAQGTFELLHVSEAQLMFREIDLPDGWLVARILLDGGDVTETGFSIPPAADSNVEIVISNAVGTISGFIEDADRNPVPAAPYVLLPAPARRTNRLFLRSGAAYEKGGFKLAAVPPGEYTLIAFPDDEKFHTSFVNQLENVERYEHLGKLVHVEAGKTSEVAVTIVPNPN